MTMLTIGFLHPGAMGISLAVAAQKAGHTAAWVAQGRSRATHARAEEHKLHRFASLEDLSQEAEIIVAICPPHAAQGVAEEVMAAGFSGTYVDANAIAPQQAKTIAEKMTAAGISCVDGSVVGPPAWQANRTTLYLSGHNAEQVAACFEGSLLKTSVLGLEIGQASALKMCYAAYTKGSTALLSAIIATASKLEVREALLKAWDQDDSGSSQARLERMQRVTAKAWRFQGEMDEIAATFATAGLPAGFHQAAAEVYERLAHFKDAETPELEQVLAALLQAED